MSETELAIFLKWLREHYTLASEDWVYDPGDENGEGGGSYPALFETHDTDEQILQRYMLDEDRA